MSLLSDLKALVAKGDVLCADEDKSYAKIDQSTNVPSSIPLYVVRVTTTAELIAVVRCCLSHKTPLVVRALGSGKSGGAVASSQSVLIDTARLNRILIIDTDDLLAEVEPSVVLSDFKAAVEERGLFYPPDPASERFCSLGGNVAENAAGPSTLKYGTTRDYFLGGQAILGTGEIIDFGKRCPKGVSGYDIASLLCGSEGTLAVFTKLILRLLPKPKSCISAIFFFHEEHRALLAVNAIFKDGHLPKTLEYLDYHCLCALLKASDVFVPAKTKAALIIECDASYEEGAHKSLTAIKTTLEGYGFFEVVFAQSPEEKQKVWHYRSLLSDACRTWLGFKISEDVAVPLGKLSLLASAVKQFEKPPHFLIGLFGHAGDGNLHVQIMFDDQRFYSHALVCRQKILLEVLRLGGTLTAEHGIGLQKKAELPLEQSAHLIALQKRIKLAWDPYNLLNPGKIFDI